MRKLAILCVLSACTAIAYGGQKEYVTGTMLSIVPSHSQTFYEGTSIDMYFYGYSVRVGNMMYSGACRERLFNGCDTNFVIGAAVQVRFDKSDMFLLRENGKELKLHVGRKQIIAP